MYKLRYSPDALNDLDEIFDYIQNELQNPVAAQRTVSNILDTIEKLRDFPKIGPSLSSVTGIESATATSRAEAILHFTASIVRMCL